MIYSTGRGSFSLGAFCVSFERLTGKFSQRVNNTSTFYTDIIWPHRAVRKDVCGIILCPLHKHSEQKGASERVELVRRLVLLLPDLTLCANVVLFKWPKLGYVIRIM